MPCNVLWNDETLKIGDALAASYCTRLDAEGLMATALARQSLSEIGGAGRDESDRHFAWQFTNSAGRCVYVCLDPLDAVKDIAALARKFLSGGRVLLVEVPCGAGAGTLGLLSAIYEQRKSGMLPTLPLNVDLLGGDVSSRGLEHFEALVLALAPQCMRQGIDVEFHGMAWNALDLRSSSQFIDRAVLLARECDQVFLLVSNFSGALEDSAMNERFQHFLSQFVGRMADEVHAVCWVEPSSNKAEKTLNVFSKALSRLIDWLSLSAKSDVIGVRYRLFDPVLNSNVTSGVRVMKAEQRGLP